MFATQGSANISYTTAGSSYTQNFDTGAQPDGSTGLPNNSQGQSPNTDIGITGTATYGWRNDFNASTAGNWSIVGWHILHPLDATGTNGVDQEGGFGGNHRMRFGTGSSTTGAFYSFGSSSGTSERALGMVNSNTMSSPDEGRLPMFMGAAFVNNSGSALTEFTLSYFGEQWRNSADAAQHKLTFDYSLNAPNIQDRIGSEDQNTFVDVPALDFTGPLSGGTAAGNLGNTTGRVQINPVTVTGIDWQPGQTLWIRWSDKNDAGADHGLAIDDLVFSADIGDVVPDFEGDHNDDGVVDAADYVAWRKLYENDPLGYDQFVANFGETAPVEIGSGGSGSVPEPGSFVLAALAVFGMFANRRSSR